MRSAAEMFDGEGPRFSEPESVGGDQSLRRLRAIEEKYRELINHLPVALLQVDASRIVDVFAGLRANGVAALDAFLEEYPEFIDHVSEAAFVTEANQEAVSLFGATTAADLMQPVGFVFAASPQTARRVIIARFEGRRSCVETTKIRTLDGRIRDVRLSVTYPAYPEQLGATLFCIEDITDRLRTEGQLRKLQAEFAHAARISMLGELTTSIAHEVNQPLAAIVTNAETSLRWLSRPDPHIEKVKQLTSRIAASAARAGDIVQRIRGMAAKHEPTRVSLDLNEIVDEALLFIRHDIESRAIDLSVRFGARLPRVTGDRIQLQQVIINLLINSVQAIVQGGEVSRRISVETRSEESGRVVFSIHDGGPGIAAENLDRIFESFFTTKDSGMGIGLAICQSIILAHGGYISAANHAGGGAYFRFWLPAYAPANYVD